VGKAKPDIAQLQNSRTGRYDRKPMRHAALKVMHQCRKQGGQAKIVI